MITWIHKLIRLKTNSLKTGFVLIGFLLSTTSAFADVSLSFLNYTTVNSFGGAISTGGSSFFYNQPNPTRYIYASGSSPAGPGSGSVFAYSYGPSTDGDYIGMSLYTNPFSYAIANGAGSMSLTFSADVYFTDYGQYNTGQSSGWFYNGLPVSNGTLFLANLSPYNFTFNYSYSGVPNTSFMVGAAFTTQNPNMSIIPLPGAMAMGACGLLRLTRSRRR